MRNIFFFYKIYFLFGILEISIEKVRTREAF